MVLANRSVPSVGAIVTTGEQISTEKAVMSFSRSQVIQVEFPTLKSSSRIFSGAEGAVSSSETRYRL